MAENSNNNSGATAKKEGNSSSSIIQGKYELGRLLGHGTFAKVYHARNLQNGTSVAIKVVGKEKVMKAGMTKQVKREIAVMKMVRHPNIVELHEVMASKSKIYIVMELVRGGELFNKIIQGRLREDAARLYFQQLISAIDFCHSRGVYHRDLKLENLLLDDHGNLKVTDFGLSAISGSCSNQDGLLHTTCGTPAYVAPEVIGSNGYDGAKSDLWSCGVILYVLLAGYLPFKDESIISLYRKINRGDFRCPPWFSPDARRLVTGLLDPNPKKRFTVPKVTDLAWFKKTAPRQSNERRPPVTETPPAEIETLNAFHIISLSDGFDLSPLFEEKRQEEKAEMRFATTKPVSSVILGLEDVASRSGGRFNVVRKGETRVELMSREEGRKGRLEIAADIFAVAPSFLMVEVKKDKGDTLEYNQFCKDYLKPALKDILWNSIGDDSITEPI